MNKILVSAGLLNLCLLVSPCLAQTDLPKPKAPRLPLQTAPGTAWERTAYTLNDRSKLEGEDWSGLLKPTRSPVAADQAESAPEQTAPLPVKVSSVHQKGITRDTIHWSDGRETGKWVYQGFVLDEGLDGVIVVTDPRFNAEHSTLLTATPFTDLFWLRSAFYGGVRRVQGKLYHYYRVDPAIAESDKPGDELLTPAMEAWIDAETGFPFASADSNSLWIYVRKPQDSADLQLPAIFREALASANKRYQRLVGRFKASKP